MSSIAVAIVGGAVISGVASNAAAKKSARAAENAADAQTQQAYAAMDQQNEQFNRVQNLLLPYVQAGQTGIEQQQRMLGLRGDFAQKESLQGIENSPYFSGLVKQGENAILQNASATGGLRGGNTQAALAQFRPNMLAAAIDQQYQRLGGLTNIGQNAAAGVGNSGQAVANANSNLLGQVGSAQAGAALAQGRAQAQGINGIASAFGTAMPALTGYYQQQGVNNGNQFNNAQAAYSQTAAGSSGFGTGAAYGNQDMGQYF